MTSECSGPTQLQSKQELLSKIIKIESDILKKDNFNNLSTMNLVYLKTIHKLKHLKQSKNDFKMIFVILIVILFSFIFITKKSSKSIIPLYLKVFSRSDWFTMKFEVTRSWFSWGFCKILLV